MGLVRRDVAAEPCSTQVLRKPQSFARPAGLFVFSTIPAMSVFLRLIVSRVPFLLQG